MENENNEKTNKLPGDRKWENFFCSNQFQSTTSSIHNNNNDDDDGQLFCGLCF